MNLSFEMLLVIGVAGFYLFDSAMLLYTNELVFVENNGKWIFSSPQKNAQILKKFLYLPNPFRPDKHIFSLYWSASEPIKTKTDKGDIQKLFLALKPLRYMTCFLLVLLFFGLPLLVFILGTGAMLLLLIEAIYLTILLMLIHVYLFKDMLKLSDKTFAKLAFDSLICAPFALNLLRKITLQHSLGDPIDFASQNFDVNRYASLIEVLQKQVIQKLQYTDENTAIYNDLKKYQDKLSRMAL